MKISPPAASPGPPSSSVVCEQIYEGINDGIEWITKRTAELLSETMMVATNVAQPVDETKQAKSATVTSSLFSSPSRPQDKIVKERAAMVNMSHNGGVSRKRRRTDMTGTMAFPRSVGCSDTTTEQTRLSTHSALQNYPRTSSLCDNDNDNDKNKPITARNNNDRSLHFNRGHPYNDLMRRQQKQHRQRRRYRQDHCCEAGLADVDDDDTKANSEQNELGDSEDEVHNINNFLRKKAWMYENSLHPRRTTAFCCSSGLDPIQEEEESTINHHESRDDQEDNPYRGWEKSSVEYLQKEPMELDEDQYLNAYDNYSFQKRGIQPKQFRPESPSKQEVSLAANDYKSDETNRNLPFEGSCITPTNVADDFMSLWTT